MAENEGKTTGSALAVVQSAQLSVGSALVGGTNAIAQTAADSQSQILEQIRDIQTKTLRAVGTVATNIKELLGFEKDAERRQREQATELGKESGGDAAQIEGPDTSKEEGQVEEGKSKIAAFGAFFAGLPGVGFIKKLLAPVLGFFGKGGFLFKLFGRFGPLGALILGFTLLYKYSDEIGKALAPALDKVKDIITKLKPVIDFLKSVGDFLIKNILIGIGDAFTSFFAGIDRFLGGFKKLFDGDILGGLNDILGGLFDAIVGPFKAVFDTVERILEPIVTFVTDFIKDIYNSITEYVSNVFNSVVDWFKNLYNDIVGFFQSAWDKVYNSVANVVTGAFNFVSDIFTSIRDFFSNAYNSVKDFVTGLPDRVMGFVKAMFQPITDFFVSIKNKIKSAINGIIDALPLPDFIKNKAKFDIEPTSADTTEPEKVFTEDVGNKTIVSQIAANEDKVKEYASLRGANLDLEQTMNMNPGNLKDKEGTLIFSKGNYSDMIPIKKLDEAIADLKSGKTGTMADLIKSETQAVKKVEPDSLKSVDDKTANIIVNQTNAPVNTNVASSKTDVHGGKLDTSVDGFHDRNSFNRMSVYS